MRSIFSKSLNVINAYSIATAIIIGWWLLAFQQQGSHYPSYYTQAENLPDSTLAPFNEEELFSIDRTQLQRALAGDLLLMGELIKEWEIDAQLLLSQGNSPVKRLSGKDYLQSQRLYRRFKFQSEVNSKHKASKASYKKLLPQTYVAASFLLALSRPDEIVALPVSLRKQTQLYPLSLTEKIPLDIDRRNSEKLFLAKPEIAFVANYSNPATIQTLRNQGIALYMMKNLGTLSDITAELVQIGNIANRPLEAEMLKIFMEAAIAAHDNKISMLAKYYTDNNIPSPRILYLNFHQKFAVPTQHTMTGQLLKRLGAFDITLTACKNEDSPQIAVPMDKERLLNLNPDCLIIAAENSHVLEKEIRIDSAFSELKALQYNKIYFVDEAIQQSPTQYIVLAYHDLIQVLTKQL